MVAPWLHPLHFGDFEGTVTRYCRIDRIGTVLCSFKVSLFHSFKRFLILFQEFIRYGAPVCTCFDGDDISSTLHVRVPNDIVESVKNIPTGNMLKFKCSLGYSQSMHTLLLVLDSDVTSMVRVVG